MSSLLQLNKMREYFLSGATRPIAFRKQQLKQLRQSILQYEGALNEALYKDLKKSKEEVWFSETGLVLSEINYFLKQIDDLAAPRRVSTNLINMPGKSYVMYEPLGVVLIIAPWNYPFQLLFLPLIGAIAAGNCIVLKPSEITTATEAVMQQIIAETFEPYYVSYVTGEGAAVIPEMMQQFKFDHVFYTGGTAVGKIIYRLAAEQLTPVTLELGGKSPCVVTPNADLKLAARRIALAKFSNAGQMCITPDYLLPHQSVKDTLVALLKETINKFYGEQPVESYDYGRIVSKKQFSRLMQYLHQGKVLAGGTHNEELLYIAPTLLEVTDTSLPIMQEEIFGPILPILTYNDDNEALQIIRQNPDPLAFYVFTNNKVEADDWLQQVPSGGACVNTVARHYLNKSLPFGGRGNSGIGRYHGAYSFETFSHQKAVLKAATWPDPTFAYPPYQGKIAIFKKLIR